MSKGKKITAGWEAEIFEWSDGTTPKILKLFFGQGAFQAKIERDITWVVHVNGGPAPKVFGDIVIIDGRSGFIMERIIGSDLDKQIRTRSFNKEFVNLIGTQLGKLHASIHRDCSIDLQRNRRQILASSIMQANGITQSEKKKTLRLLDDLPDGDRLCHCDFHFGNVVSGYGGQVVIDWGNAGMGNPLADVAQTQLLITTSWIGASFVDIVFSGLIRKLKTNLNRSYTEAYFSESEENPAGVNQWRTVVAAARLGDWLPGMQRRYLAKLVRGGLGH